MGRIVAGGRGSAAAWGRGWGEEVRALRAGVSGQCVPFGVARALRRGLAGRPTWEGAGKETEKLRPPRPLPGTEVPGTESPEGRASPPTSRPRNRPAGPRGPPPGGGRTRSRTSGAPVSHRERTSCPHARSSLLPGDFCLSENQLFTSLALTCLSVCAHLARAATPPLTPPPISGRVIYIRKRLRPGPQPSPVPPGAGWGWGWGLAGPEALSLWGEFSEVLGVSGLAPPPGSARVGDEGMGGVGDVQRCEAMSELCSITYLKFLGNFVFWRKVSGHRLEGRPAHTLILRILRAKGRMMALPSWCV